MTGYTVNLPSKDFKVLKTKAVPVTSYKNESKCKLVNINNEKYYYLHVFDQLVVSATFIS